MPKHVQAKAAKEFPSELINHSLDFDFDRWAAEVRQQMLAALRKRGSAVEDID